MKLESVAQSTPVFDFKSYFLGHTKASGWFSDRFGNVRKHFSGDFVGSIDGNAYTLEETLNYSDGIVDKRIWDVVIGQDGSFRASSDSLIGGATGQLRGNTLNLNYRMNVAVANNRIWKLSMNDWMFFQPDGSLHNITRVSKWGFHIGTVSTQYTKINSAKFNNTSANDEAMLKGGSFSQETGPSSAIRG